MNIRVAALVCALVLVPLRVSAETKKDIPTQADEIENQAVALIDQRHLDEGLALMLKAIDLDPSAQRYMNYGSVLFGNGVSAYKSGDKEEGKRILMQAQTALKKAILTFDANKDAMPLSQCYFLLGEIASHALADPQKAKDYYQKSTALYDNPSAKTALDNLK